MYALGDYLGEDLLTGVLLPVRSPPTALAVDTADTTPKRAAARGPGVLSKGSPAARALARHKAEDSNPWEVVLSPRNTKADVRVTKGQSPTTAARARRVRREKALAKIAAEEEIAAKKGGIAYARRMRQEKAEKARAKLKADRLNKKLSRVKGRGVGSKKTRVDKTAAQSTPSNKMRSKGGNHNKNSGTVDTVVDSSKAKAGAKKVPGATTSSRSRASARSSFGTKSRMRSRANRSGSKSNKKDGASGDAVPTRAKLRQLKQEADTQESIRALIDKVTIDFERMPSDDIPSSARSQATR